MRRVLARARPQGGRQAEGRLGRERELAGDDEALEGVVQVTYAGFPLYVFSGDHKAGEVNGEGFKDFKGQWFVVNAKGAFVKKAVSTGGGSSGGAWANRSGPAMAAAVTAAAIEQYDESYWSTASWPGPEPPVEVPPTSLTSSGYAPSGY